MDFGQCLADAAARTDAVLAAVIEDLRSDARTPKILVDATQYALLGGGKRFRPFLVIECAKVAGHDGDASAHVGAAFECLHAYSLVHDDLPAMDDDDLRRGRPTVHKAFDEATAILVGDALQALAFEIITSGPVGAEAAGTLAHLLAVASGVAGMVGGQYRDLNADGLDRDGVRLMQSMKTGALIGAACEAGAVVAHASPETRATLRTFGDRIGEAFQLADDLLDIEGTAEETGKRVGKDDDEGKVTIPQLVGVEAARQRLWQVVEEASACLEPFGERGALLRDAARFVAERRS